jgi:hypothetical protein
MQTIGNLEVPEIKYYRDAFGNQHERSSDCINNIDIDPYDKVSGRWMYKYRNQFPYDWQFWDWVNSEDDSVKYFYYCRQLGILNEENYNYAPEEVLQAIEDSRSFVPVQNPPKFSKYGKYNNLCYELYKSCGDIERVKDFLDEELVRLTENNKLIFKTYLKNFNISDTIIPNNTIEQEKRSELLNDLHHEIKELEELKNYLTDYSK